MAVPPKFKYKTTIWSSNPLLGMYSKELKTETWIDICAPMFTAALLTITKKWKQSKYSSMDEWINKIHYVYIYIKRNIVQPSKGMKFWYISQMNLEIIMLSETPIQILCPFKKWVNFLLSCKSSSYILETRPFSDIRFAKYLGCLFTFLMMSFEARKF